MYFWDKHKTITGYYELLSAEVCDRYGLTQMEYDIRMFLHNNPQHNTATEIVKVRKSTKSHVSTSLKNLENEGLIERIQTSVYKGYKQDKIEMRGDRAEMSDFPLYLNTVAGGLDRRDQTIGGFSFVVKIYAVPVVEIIG